MGTIRYTCKLYDDEKGKSFVDERGVNGHAYVPSIDDARTWSNKVDEFMFVQELMGLSSYDDGADYVTLKVNRVESAFERLLNSHSPEFPQSKRMADKETSCRRELQERIGRGEEGNFWSRAGWGHRIRRRS